MIVDISAVPDGGAVREVAEGNWNQLYRGAADPANYDNNLITHSMTPTPDGRVTDLAQEAGRIIDEYRIAQNLDSFCRSPADDPATEQFNSYTSHNPTLLRDLAFVTWHSGGLQAIRIDRGLRQAGWFSPRPLDAVANEDPALSAGPNKVVMWSFPIIKDGLIYVIDIRNGLYILRYTSDRQCAVRRISFLEGNSNLGDAPSLASHSGDDD
jgi:hypothetical protein